MRMSFWHREVGAVTELVVQLPWDNEHFWTETALSKLSHKIIPEKCLPQYVTSFADWLIYNYAKLFAE